LQRDYEDPALDVANELAQLTEGQRQELRELRRHVAQAVQCRVDALLSLVPTLPTIWHHGDRAYSRDRINSFVVTPEEDHVLQTFLKSGKAMDTRDVTNRSGVTNVSRTIRALRSKYGGVFADAIRTPPDGKKGAGGYLILVRDAGS
jgi:hypothetical protein